MTLTELETIDAIDRFGSLVRAARHLNVSAAAVSRRLSALEQRLRIRLFDRTTRRLSPTHEGQVLIGDARRLLQELQELDARVSADAQAASGHFRVLATLGYGREVIAPILSEYSARHPRLTVDLTLTQGFSEEFKAFDIAVVIGATPSKSFLVQKLASNARVVVASPKYIKRHGAPRVPADLHNHRCLVMSETGMDATTWALECKGTVEAVRVAPHLSSNDGAVVVDWAVAGHGLTLRSRWTVRQLLQSGKLVEVLRGYEVPADVYAVWPRSRYVSPRVQQFVNFIADRIGGT